MNIGHKYLKIMLSHSESKARVLFSFIISLILVFVLRGTVSAAATYDPSTNTIYLGLGNNTLDSIYTDISNSSALSYDPATNTYTLNAKIDSSGAANLNIENATLLINNSIDDEYYIQVGWDLIINNAIIKSSNGKRFYIWAPTKGGNGWIVLINNSVIDGGLIRIKPGIGYYDKPGPPYVRILNTTIKNVDMTSFTSADRTWGVLYLHAFAGYNALLQDLKFENVHGGEVYTGTITYHSDADNIIFRNILFLNTSHPVWGAIHDYGTALNATYENITILNRTGDGEGISYKEGPFSVTNYFKNIIIKDINGYSGGGFHTYANKFPSNGTGGAIIENLTIDGGVTKVNFLFLHDYFQFVTVKVFNAQLKNANTGFRTRNNKYFFTNSKVENVTKMYDSVFGVENGEVNWYELLDVKVVDSSGNPINGANIQITPDVGAPVPNVVDKWFNAQSSILTGSDGHTPLPSNETGTVAILRKRDSASGTASTSYSYTITASYVGKTASATVASDATWYRTDPLVPVNTITIQLPTSVTPTTIDVNQDGAVDISDLRIVALHFGETTASPYPRYDVNTDGTVDILDLRQVAGGM